MEPQKQGNSPGPGPEILERQRVAKEQAAQRVNSWTVQNEMRDVLGRAHSESDKGAQVPRWELREPVCQRI